MTDLRITVQDAWDEVSFPFRSDAVLGDLKREALTRTRVDGHHDEFLLKFMGAELRDESATVADAEIPESGSLIVVRRKRRPVR